MECWVKSAERGAEYHRSSKATQGSIVPADSHGGRVCEPGVSMTVRIRVIALVVMVLGTGLIAAGPDASAPRTPHEALGLLKAGNDRFARNASSPVSLSVNRPDSSGPMPHPWRWCSSARIRGCP